LLFITFIKKTKINGSRYLNKSCLTKKTMPNFKTKKLTAEEQEENSVSAEQKY
jgi:hypothetical protein